MAPVQAAYQYPPAAAAAAASDFPVAMTASTKYDVLFMLTKMGFIYVVDTKTGATIFSNQVSAQPVFIAAAHEASGGIAFVNQGGQVLSVTLDEDNVIEYIATQLRNIEVAQRLSARNNLPGAVIDQMLQQQFEALFQQSNFAGCAELAFQAEKLRTKATITRLQAAPAAPGAPPAVMVYFQTLLNKGKLNTVETIALIGVLLPMGQMAFIEQKLGEDKLACTEEVGDLFKTQINNPKLAMQVYLKGKCHGKVITSLLETGQAAKVGPYLDQAGETDVDWTDILQTSVASNPASALELAVMLVGKGEALDKGAVADMFVKASAIQQATGFLINALQGDSKEEDAALQTKALEIPLANGFPQVADDIMGKGVFLHFDKGHIAKLCEKHNVPSRALALFTEPEDIKRVIVNTQQLQPEFLVGFFGTMEAPMQMECMEVLLTNNPKGNMRLVATVAAKYSESVGAAELTEMFKKHKADEGLFLYLSTLVNSTLDPEIHFGYIEAAAKSNNIPEVERMTRESTCYDAERVRDLLMELKLQDPRPLINVCNAHNFVPELVKYFREQNQMKFIEQYALKVNVAAVPVVCGTLIDLQTNEDFIKNLILAGGNMIPAKTLMDEMQSRGKLKMIMPWLEARVNEGSTDSAVHTALAKIYVDSNQNPEQFLLTNKFYDALDVGKHCESINPELAATAYEKGKCHDAMVALTTANSMFKKQAQYLVDCMDDELWGRVLAEDTEARGHLVENLVGQVLPDCKEAHKVALCVKVFLDADLPNYLIELLDKIVVQTGQFKGEKNLETLLIMTAVKSSPERVQDYVSKLDNIDPVAVAGACVEGKLLDEAIALYEKASENEKVMDVLVNHMKDMTRATSFAAQCDDSAVWSLLARSQLDEGLVSQAIETFAKGNDSTAFNEVIAAAQRENAYEPLVSYLTMCRQSAKNEMIDTELVYAYCKTGKLVDLEQFIMGPNIANVGALGERCFNEEMYEAAKIMFNNVGDFTRLVTTLCKLNDLAGAVEAARKANTISTWRDVCKTAVDQKEFRIAQQCGVYIIVEPDELEDLISYYEQEGYVEEIMEVIEGGMGLERAHMGMFTELGVLYAKYKVEKLLEHCKVFWARLNISKLIRVCEVGEHWAVQCFLYEKFDEYDNAVMCMINHVAEAFDHSMFKELLSKGNNIEIAHKAIDFYITYAPLELNDMLVFLAQRLDPMRVVAQIQRNDNLSLVKAYMQQVQQLNLPKLNEALNDLYIEEGDYQQLRQSVDMYANIDLISLAKQLESHECLEFRRVATHLFKKAQQWELAVGLAKKDKLYKDAISTAATSQDPMLVDSLLTFFVEEKEKECFAASLFMCYDYVHPDVVMELAWRNDIMDFAMPYFIQVMGEFKTMRHQLKEMAVALTAIMMKDMPQQPQAPPQQQQQQQQQQMQQAPPQQQMQQAPPPQEAAGGFGFISQ